MAVLVELIIYMYITDEYGYHKNRSEIKYDCV